MNNKMKLALAIIGAGTAVAWGMNRKKKLKSKTFTAPDGNTYKENQIYRTFDNKLYKNGKEIHFETPALEQNASGNHAFDEHSANLSKNYEAINKDINYHQKGVRHH
ncbi:hypothetical protein EG349_03740 [Chryseobacterium shandongense]|uniref:Uncharacterized protein n=1 Tax=Chryseobacterium shandongense TaxID=1493872 RepID=A0AAD0YBM5_9FLAO|nr:hypothetical protein [Chryseobacterium shandongense]AZA85960.1 hypothetical protein EG349_03740 [Chryseobacterium shandongense]AZA94368.1 hypothetical protein EG353_01765 [Chryseobacterium shandongense]